MKELSGVLEEWIDGKIRTLISSMKLLNVIDTHEDQIHKLEEDTHFAFCDIQRIEKRLKVLEASTKETFTITLPLSSKNVLEVAIDHEIEHHDGLICDPHHCDGEKIEFKARRRALCSIKEDF